MLRVPGKVDGIPLFFALFLGAFAILPSVLGGWVGLLLGGLLGVPAGWFAWMCIPSSATLDAEGLTFRKKLRTQRVLWSEVVALGTGFGEPGTLLVRLNHEAAFDHQVPASDAIPKKKLLQHALEHWKAAGGDGTTFDVTQTFLESTRQLRQGVEKLAEIQNDTSCEVREERDPELVLVVKATSRTPAGMTSAIRRVVESALTGLRYNPEFSGEIRLSLITTELPPVLLGPSFEKVVEQLDSDFSKRGITASGGRPLRFTLR
jgi:hypothetical protein